MVRRMFRGSGAAIIALLGEPSCKVLRTEGTGVDGPISSRSKDVYVVVGREEYLLCHQDLKRLRDHGYIYLSGSSQDSSFKLSCRIELGQSQSSFAAMLGVSPESYLLKVRIPSAAS